MSNHFFGAVSVGHFSQPSKLSPHFDYWSMGLTEKTGHHLHTRNPVLRLMRLDHLLPQYHSHTKCQQTASTPDQLCCCSVCMTSTLHWCWCPEWQWRPHPAKPATRAIISLPHSLTSMHSTGEHSTVHGMLRSQHIDPSHCMLKSARTVPAMLFVKEQATNFRDAS